MHLMYIDESGDHGLKNLQPEFPVFVLCGIIIDENEVKRLDTDFNKLKNKFWGNKKVIFHSRDIRKCEKEFQILLDLEVKKDFYNDLNNIISKSNFTVVAPVINKEKHIKKYGKLAENVYELSLSFLIERSIFYLDSISSEIRKVYIESRGKREDNELKNFLNILKHRGTSYIDSNRVLSKIKEFEFIKKDEGISGLQLADLAAYPIARYAIDKNRANPAYDLLKEKIYRKGNKIYGLKIFP